jgi:hypothetical protein
MLVFSWVSNLAPVRKLCFDGCMYVSSRLWLLRQVDFNRALKGISKWIFLDFKRKESQNFVLNVGGIWTLPVSNIVIFFVNPLKILKYGNSVLSLPWRNLKTQPNQI